MSIGPRVAYDPAALEQNVRRYVAVAERNLAALDAAGKDIQPLLDRLKPVLDAGQPGTVFDDLERFTIVYDRLAKAGLNLVKAIDELSRLQSFLSGGPDSRPDLTGASEIELRAILVKGVRALGIQNVQELFAPPPDEAA